MLRGDLVTLIEEYEKSKEVLVSFLERTDEFDPDRAQVISMLNEVNQVIERMKGSDIESKRRLFPWSPEWMERFSVPSFEDEVIDRLDNGTVEEEVEFAIRFDLSFLTARQKDCLTMVADGCTYIDTADMLGVEKGTVSKHLQIARKKARSSLQLSLF